MKWADLKQSEIFKAAIGRKWSVFPALANKRPAIHSWKELQYRRPTQDELKNWNGARAWAVVTGAISSTVVIDFDGDAGRKLIERLALQPHVRTPSEGFHVYVRHPGWRVPTLTSKASHRLAERYAGLDVRGDGGYALFLGRTDKGEYEWQRKVEPDPVEVLPDELRAAIGLVEPKQDVAEAPALIRAALNRAPELGRNNAGMWLACQLRDNGFTELDAESFLREYAHKVPPANAHGERDPYTVDEALASLKQAYARSARLPLATRHAMRTMNEQTIDPPDAYKCDEAGLWCFDAHDRTFKRVGPPLWIDGRTQDFSGEGCGKLVRFRDWNDRERTCVIPLWQLVGDNRECIDRLLSMGYQPRPDAKALRQLKRYIYDANPRAFITRATTVGWHGNLFVLPGRTIGGASEDQVVFDCGAPIEHKFRSRGTLDEWRDQVGRLCSGNTILLVATSAAFAAPLLDLVNADGGGIHLRGGSSMGKTTALRVAGSVVGGGDTEKGYLETWRATASGMETRAAVYNHMLLCLDEIGEIPEREVGELVYILANGGGKARSTRNITLRPSVQFKLLFLSTGERTLRDLMAAAGQQVKGGQEARLIDIDADAGLGVGVFERLHGFRTGQELATQLQQVTTKYYGTAISPFLEHLVEDRASIAARVRERRTEFLAACVPEGSAGEVFRVASLFGVIAAAGEEATKVGITGWNISEPWAAAQHLFGRWIRYRGGTGASDVEAGLRAVRSFINTNPNRFQDLADDEPSSNSRVIGQRAGFREHHGEGAIHYIFQDVFEAEICRGYDAQAIARELDRRNHLKRHASDKSFTMRKRVKGLGRERFYAVLDTVFDDASQDGRVPSLLENENEHGQ